MHLTADNSGLLSGKEPTVVRRAHGRATFAETGFKLKPAFVDDGLTDYVVPRDDGPALAARIEQLLGDPARAPAMSVRARAAVADRHTAETMAVRTLATYRHALSAPVATPRQAPGRLNADGARAAAAAAAGARYA